jgi:hypothetical protein
MHEIVATGRLVKTPLIYQSTNVVHCSIDFSQILEMYEALGRDNKSSKSWVETIKV